MDYKVTEEDRLRYITYRANVEHFVQEVLTAAVIENADYVPGTTRIKYYEDLIEGPNFKIFDHRRASGPQAHGPYEEALYHRATATAYPTMLVLIGGLGAGKSTVARYLCDVIGARRTQLAAAYPCHCSPCVRRPLIINCDMERVPDLTECKIDVLERIRHQIFITLINEWYLSNGLDPVTLKDMDRKVLRRLLIANDIYHFSESDRPELPPGLHTSDLELDSDLFSKTPQEWASTPVLRARASAANAIDFEIERVSTDPVLAKRFTRVVVGYWLSRCNAQSPNSLIVIDNLDQQPTNHIEQIVNLLNDLDPRRRGLRLIVPLRPSSIVTHGFTSNIGYMYHYGPNCFDMIYRRLSKQILMLDRSALTGALSLQRSGVATPSPDEVRIIYIVAYVYALICVYGLREPTGEHEDVRPKVADDANWLYNLKLTGAAVAQLADTLRAVVGTCGRYATDQLRRYFDHVYRHAAFLRHVETAGLGMKANPNIRIPYGQVVSAILGPPEADAGTNVTGLANLYSATEPRANPTLPSLAKLRVLVVLRTRPRRRVRAVVAALAQHGIPVEVSIDALNYLHAKKRLLLWFSRNSDLAVCDDHLDQDVVLSEHGSAYLQDLIGDFEYVWFCARQLSAVATADSGNHFIDRLRDYEGLLTEFSRTELKQMTFHRLAAGGGAAAPSAREVRADEMLTLYVLYSSFDRALGGASVAAGQADAEYMSEVVNLLDALADTIERTQESYHLYFGHNGYLAAYASKIEHCREQVSIMMRDDAFEAISDKLGAILSSWAQPVVVVNGSGFQQECVDDLWLTFVDAIPATSDISEEHARSSLRERLAAFLGRRRKMRDALSSGFPYYVWLVTEVELTLVDGRAAYDAADRLAAYTETFMKWLKQEIDALAAVQQGLAGNRFSIPDVATMDAMDDMKLSANALCVTYSTLAQRLGSLRTSHFAAYWSV